jgi:hypothetical protein
MHAIVGASVPRRQSADDIPATADTFAGTLQAMDRFWFDPEAAWWAKAARARRHVHDAVSMAAGYQLSAPYEVRREATDRAGEAVFRFHVLRPVPVELLTTIGDAIHNMRSCLDSVAHEFARQHVGSDMSEQQERATQFPLFKDRAEFDDFFDSHRHRQSMYGQRERDAMRCVQPFAIPEETSAQGVDWSTSPEDHYKHHELARLSHLSNVDKHRRLPLLAWYLEFAYFTREVSGIRLGTQPSSDALQDGSVFASITDPSGRQAIMPEPAFEFSLALIDDPAAPHDLVSVLEGWHSYLVGWALPRMFAVIDGNPPPIAIARQAAKPPTLLSVRPSATTTAVQSPSVVTSRRQIGVSPMACAAVVDARR